MPNKKIILMKFKELIKTKNNRNLQNKSYSNIDINFLNGVFSSFYRCC